MQYIIKLHLHKEARKLKDAKMLTKAQEDLVDSVGLLHTEWLCFFENAAYMHLLKKENDPAEIKIINKKKRIVLTPTKAK